MFEKFDKNERKIKFLSTCLLNFVITFLVIALLNDVDISNIKALQLFYVEFIIKPANLIFLLIAGVVSYKIYY